MRIAQNLHSYRQSSLMNSRNLMLLLVLLGASG